MGEKSFILLVITVHSFCGSATLSLSTVGGNHHSRLLLTYGSKAALLLYSTFVCPDIFHMSYGVIYLLTWVLKVIKFKTYFQSRCIDGKRNQNFFS